MSRRSGSCPICSVSVARAGGAEAMPGRRHDRCFLSHASRPSRVSQTISRGNASVRTQCCIPFGFPVAREEVESLKGTIRVHEQLTRPLLQCLSAHFDLDLRGGERSGRGKEEPPRLAVLEAMDDEAVSLVPRNVQPRIVVVLRDDDQRIPPRKLPSDAEQFRSVSGRSVLRPRERGI